MGLLQGSGYNVLPEIPKVREVSLDDDAMTDGFRVDNQALYDASYSITFK